MPLIARDDIEAVPFVPRECVRPRVCFEPRTRPRIDAPDVPPRSFPAGIRRRFTFARPAAAMGSTWSVIALTSAIAEGADTCVFRPRFQTFCKESSKDSWDRGFEQANCAASSCLEILGNGGTCGGRRGVPDGERWNAIDDNWWNGDHTCVKTIDGKLDEGAEWTSNGNATLDATGTGDLEWLAYDFGYFLGEGGSLDEQLEISHVCIRWGTESGGTTALKAQEVRVDYSKGLVVGARVDVARMDDDKKAADVGQRRIPAEIEAVGNDGSTYTVKYLPFEYEDADERCAPTSQGLYSCPTEVAQALLRLDLEQEENWVSGEIYTKLPQGSGAPAGDDADWMDDSCFELAAPVTTQHVRLVFSKTLTWANTNGLANEKVKVAEVRFKGTCRTAAASAPSCDASVESLDLVVPIDSSSSVNKYSEWANLLHGVNSFIAEVARLALASDATLRVARAPWSSVRSREALYEVTDPLVELHHDVHPFPVGGTYYAQALLNCLEAFDELDAADDDSAARRVCAVFGDGGIDDLKGGSKIEGAWTNGVYESSAEVCDAKSWGGDEIKNTECAVSNCAAVVKLDKDHATCSFFCSDVLWPSLKCKGRYAANTCGLAQPTDDLGCDVPGEGEYVCECEPNGTSSAFVRRSTCPARVPIAT